MGRQQQLDWRWVERYRELASYDSYWWLAPTGPFNDDEQRQWDELFSPSLNEASKEQLGQLIAQARTREFEAALAEQRQPHLHYPALDIHEVRAHIAGLLQLDAEILKEEANAIVRRLYHETIEEELDFLYLIEATYEGNNEKFWHHNVRLNPVPTPEEMHYAFSRVEQMLYYGFQRTESAEASQQIIDYFREHLKTSIDLSDRAPGGLEWRQEVEIPGSQRKVSTHATKRFFETVLHDAGYDDWQVVIDFSGNNARVEQGLRCIFLPQEHFTVERIQHWVSHELASHAGRCIAGERSPLGLLGIHTKNSLVTEEGLATYYDRAVARLHGKPYNDITVWGATLVTGLASGAVTPPQTFLALVTFLETFYTLYYLLQDPDIDVQWARKTSQQYALSVCMRKFRGVPDLQQAGICYTQDVTYLRGLWQIERAVARDETVLDWLAAGVFALEQLPDIQTLGIIASPQPLRQLANDPGLDEYILSFERG